MVERVQIVSSEDAQRLAEEQKNKNNTNDVNSLVRTLDVNSTKLRIQFGSGEGVQANGVQRGSASLVKDGTVRLPNGRVTSVVAAEAAGFVQRDANGNFVVTDPDFMPEGSKKISEPEVNAEEKAIADHNSAYDQAEAIIGHEGLRSTAADFINGDLEALDATLAAVPDAVFDALYDGYVRNASSAMAEAGLPDVELLDDILPDDSPLREMARRGIITNDRQALRSVAYQAVQALKTGEGVAESFIADLEALGISVYGGANGSGLVVSIPGTEGPMSLATAIQLGYISRS